MGHDIDRLEVALAHAGRCLTDMGIARLWKTDGPVDFVGFDWQGKAILIEAKGSLADRLSLNQRPGMTALQRNALRDAHAAGAWSWLAWAHDPEMMLIPASVLEGPQFEGGREKMIRIRKTVGWGDHPIFPLTELAMKLIEALREPPGTPKVRLLAQAAQE